MVRTEEARRAGRMAVRPLAPKVPEMRERDHKANTTRGNIIKARARHVLRLPAVIRRRAIMRGLRPGRGSNPGKGSNPVRNETVSSFATPGPGRPASAMSSLAMRQMRQRARSGCMATTPLPPLWPTRPAGCGICW